MNARSINAPEPNNDGGHVAFRTLRLAAALVLAVAVVAWALLYSWPGSGPTSASKDLPTVPDRRAASGPVELVPGFVFLKDNYPELANSVIATDKSRPVYIRLELDVAGTDLDPTCHYSHIDGASDYIDASNGIVAMGKGVRRELTFTGVGGSPEGGIEIELVLAEDRETIDWAMDFHNQWQPWVSSMPQPPRPQYPDGTEKPPFLADAINFGDRNLTCHDADEGPYIRFQRRNFMAKVTWFGNSSAASAVMPIAEQILSIIDAGGFVDAAGFAASSPPAVSLALSSNQLSSGNLPGYAASAKATPINLGASVIYTSAHARPGSGLHLDNFTMPTTVEPGNGGSNQIHVYAVHDNLRYTFSAIDVSVP